MKMNEQVSMFLDKVSGLGDDYKAIEVYVVAFKWQGQWVNLCTRAILATRKPKQYRFMGTPPNISDLFIDRDILPIDSLNEFTAVFDNFELNWKNRKILMEAAVPKSSSPYLTPRYASYERDWGVRLLNLDFFSYVLSGSVSFSNQSLNDEWLKNLESGLSSLEIPYRSIGDLVEAFTGSQHISSRNLYGKFEIIAPIMARLDPSCQIRNDKAVIAALLREGHEPEKTSVAVIESEGAEVRERRTVPLKVDSVGKRGEIHLSAEPIIDRHTDRIDLFLSYKGQRVDSCVLYRNRVSRKNPRMMVFSIVDPDLKRFGNAIKGNAPTKKGVEFELAFQQLLSFLGFSSIHIGKDERQADVLAWGIKPSFAFMIECTTDISNLVNKISKLSGRVRNFKKAVDSVETLGMIAATISEDLINPNDVERMRSERIIRIDSQSLDRLVKLAENGGGIGEALALLQELANSQGVNVSL